MSCNINTHWSNWVRVLYLLLFVNVLLNFKIRRKIMENMKISLFNLMVPTMESSLLKSLSEFSYCVYVPGYVQVYVCHNTCVNVRKWLTVVGSFLHTCLHPRDRRKDIRLGIRYTNLLRHFSPSWLFPLLMYFLINKSLLLMPKAFLSCLHLLPLDPGLMTSGSPYSSDRVMLIIISLSAYPM